MVGLSAAFVAAACGAFFHMSIADAAIDSACASQAAEYTDLGMYDVGSKLYLIVGCPPVE